LESRAIRKQRLREHSLKEAARYWQSWRRVGGLTEYLQSGHQDELSCRAYVLTANEPIPPGCWSQEPWDAPAHWCLREYRPFSLCWDDSGNARVLAIVGADTLFDSRLGELARTEVLSALAILIESNASKVQWMAPYDLDVAALVAESRDESQ